MFARCRVPPGWQPMRHANHNLNLNLNLNSRRYASMSSQQSFSYGAVTRPFFKVFLGASFIYQTIYWSWLRLEMDDFKANRQRVLAALEERVQELSVKQ